MFYLLAGSIIKWLSLKKVFLFWVFWVLIVAPITVNAQAYLILNPSNYTFPQCVQGHSCGRVFVFPWAPVVTGSVTQHMVFLDNLPNDSTGTTTIVQWNVASYNVDSAGNVVFESPITVSLNGLPDLAASMIDVGQCSVSGCHGTLDLLAPVCNGGFGSACTVPPPRVDPTVIAYVATMDGRQVGKLAPPTIQMYDKNGNPVGEPLSAIWLDEVQQDESWISTVTFGGTYDCAVTVVNLSPTQTVRPIATATLTGSGLSFIGTTVLPVNLYDQFQMATFQCSQLFPQIAGMPATAGVIEVSFSGGEGAVGVQQQTPTGIIPEQVLPLVHPARQEPRPPVIRRPHLSHPLVTSSDD